MTYPEGSATLAGHTSYSGNFGHNPDMVLIVSLGYTSLFICITCMAFRLCIQSVGKRGAKDPQGSFARSHATLVQYING
jgi:hypothetical protein